jgi:hypothetical protein
LPLIALSDKYLEQEVAMIDKKVQSLNDLSISIHLINKKYKIKEFIDEYRKQISEVNDLLREELIAANGLSNPVQKVIQVSQQLTEEEIDKTVAIVESLSSKYDYNSYIEECEKIRRVFMQERDDYFAIKATKSQAKIIDEVTTLFELTGASELILSKWLDAIVEKVNPKILEIHYEDIDGKKKKARVKYRNAGLNDDFVEAPLIDRYHGINAYDSFLLHSFFDADKNKWIYIPVKLIISIQADEDLEDILNVNDEKKGKK